MTRFAGDRVNNIRKFGLDPIEPVGDTFRDIGNAGRDMQRQYNRHDIKNNILYNEENQYADYDNFIDSVSFNYGDHDDMPNHMYDQERIEGMNYKAGNIIHLNLDNKEGSNTRGRMLDRSGPHLNLGGIEYRKDMSQNALQGIREESEENQNVLMRMIGNEKRARVSDENDAQAFENRMLFGLINEAPSMNMYDYRESEFDRYTRIKNTRKALDNFDVFNRGPEFNRTAPNVKNIDVAGIREQEAKFRASTKAKPTWNTNALTVEDYEDDIPF